MEKKSIMPGYFAVSFIWFTTHFGGGFASGRQLIAFFTQYGWYAIFTTVLSVGVQALVFYYGWKYAVDHRINNYREWTNKFFSPYGKIFSNIYEIIYNILLMAGTAIAFATGGSTLTTVFGTPYIINTIILAIIIFGLTIFGADIVRKAATAIAIALIVGIFIIYVPNIIILWPKIIANIEASRTGTIVNTYSLGTALWKSLLYAGFQSCCICAFVAHSDALKDRKDVKKATIWGFVINGGIMLMATLGIFAYYGSGIENEVVPVLYLVKNGVGSSWMIPIVAMLIIIGSASTGINLIYGITARLTNLLARNDSPEIAKAKERKRTIAVSAGYVILTWCIALFGLISLVGKGYGAIGYVAVFLVIIPVLFRGIKGWEKTEKVICKE